MKPEEGDLPQEFNSKTLEISLVDVVIKHINNPKRKVKQNMSDGGGVQIK